MPIANVYVRSDQRIDTAKVVARWSTFSEISSDEMTLNVVDIREQRGKPYDAMAWLYLSSSWSTLEREDLGLALCRALADALEVTTERIFVVSLVLPAGHVVETGDVVRR